MRSSLLLQQLHIHPGTDSSGVAVVRSSSVTLSLCSIDVAPYSSPFVVVEDFIGAATVLSLISSRIKPSSSIHGLLPLTEVHTSELSSAYTQSTSKDILSSTLSSVLSVSGIDLAFDSVDFSLGTGPLIDFGIKQKKSLIGSIEFSTLLDKTSFINVTSQPANPSLKRRDMQLSQRLVGTTMSSSSNHLSGTCGVRPSWGVDTLISNASFSHCVTNASPDPVTEPSDEDPSNVQYVRAEPADPQWFDNENPPKENHLFIVNSSFNDMIAEMEGGAAVHSDDSHAHITIKRTNFMSCFSGTSGGAIFAYISPNTSHNFVAYECIFSQNWCVGEGGHAVIVGFNVTIAKTTFSDSKPLPEQTPPTCSLYFQANPSIRIDNSTLSRNNGTQCGGIFIVQGDQGESHTAVLSDILFESNICANWNSSEITTDLLFDRSEPSIKTYNCFSTSQFHKCSSVNHDQHYPTLIGPSVLSLPTPVEEENPRGGFQIAVTLSGLFTGTGQAYTVTFCETGSYTPGISVDDVTFTQSRGTVRIPIGAGDGLEFDTEYNISNICKVDLPARNDIAESGQDELEWTWWIFDQSFSSELSGLTFKTKPQPKLVSVDVRVKSSFNQIVEIVLTVDRVTKGEYFMIVTDDFGEQIDVGCVAFDTSMVESSASLEVDLRQVNLLPEMQYSVLCLLDEYLAININEQLLKIPTFSSSAFIVSSSGDDGNEGSMDLPFKTLSAALKKAEGAGDDVSVVIVDSVEIGEVVHFDGSTTTMSQIVSTVEGDGDGKTLLCSVSDGEWVTGTTREYNAMINLIHSTLNYNRLVFSPMSPPHGIVSVFSVGAKSTLAMSECSLQSQTPIVFSFVSVKPEGKLQISQLTCQNLTFSKKSSLVEVQGNGTSSLANCSFSSISFSEGGVLVGKTSSGFSVSNSTFVGCSGTRFGSLIRMNVIGCKAQIIKSHFENCSTQVSLSKMEGMSGVMGGGCVVVVMESAASRRLPASSVDFTSSSFTLCTLTNTDPTMSSVRVGGSAFLIVGNGGSETVVLRGVQISKCTVQNLLPPDPPVSSAYLVLSKRQLIHTDRRGLVVK
ncbi:hypothetical protein BLNAU_16804 [Blattamonas nauphoetae]|uniref:Uncharacterized protein n=1 Tax=Blattamonas nauphoetae TaxID=2049346 RepID=A0ABQ9X860_9EUKA|nr:hypothetical protein BLNAU_16804 [Blattamonas nauphoetae]